MGKVNDPSGERPSGSDDALDRGLAEAFGDARADRPAASVLTTLEARTGSALSVHLESGGLEDAPVRVTEEVRRLRDPGGRYQVLGEIGRGGMGVVYKGRDVDLGRDVAMKVLKDEYAERPDVLARFVEEAQIGGQLQHPGIVPVYELGLHAGERVYFAMKLVKGETLAAQLARRADPSEDRRRLLGIFEQICQTVAYAHARRVVHRDLKPANVMIGAFGEVQIVDWGFAKILPHRGEADDARGAASAGEPSVIETVRSASGSSSPSVPGSIMGTLAYMPPEQASGDIGALDRRSDVFALGAILCEILTGAPPYRSGDDDLVRQAVSAELGGAFERLDACGADEALVALCRQCLAPAQRARPQSAAEVAERVGRWVSSVEERARRAELSAAEARYKTRTTVTAATAGLAVILLAAGGWTWVGHQAQARRSAAAQRIAAATSTTSAARGRAQAAGLDATLWSAATSSAEQLVALARSEDLPASREQAEELLARVREEADAAATEAERRARDVAMIERLEAVRMLPPAEQSTTPEWRDRDDHRLDADYREAFAAYLGGTSVLELPLEAALASLRHGDVEDQLATALDHWALVRSGAHGTGEPPDPEGTARIRELAALLDPSDAWRVELRALLQAPALDRERLKLHAERADFATLSAASYRLLADALWTAGEPEWSAEVLRRGREVHPQDFDLCFRLADCLQRLERPQWEEALSTYRIAQALRPEHDELLHRQGLALGELGRFAEAERVYRGLLKRAPRGAHWMWHLGYVLLRQGKNSEAIEWCQNAVEIQPAELSYGVAYDIMGMALRREGRLEEAERSFRKALQFEPNALVYQNLAVLLRQQGRIDECIDAYRHAVELDAGNAVFHSALAFELAENGRLDEAIVSVRKALALDPRNARAHLILGGSLTRMGRLDEGIESLRTSLEIDPQDTHAHRNLGDALFRQGKLDEAIDTYRVAIELDPESGPNQMNLGVALYDRMAGLGRASLPEVEEALAALERAAELFAREGGAFGRKWEGLAREMIEKVKALSNPPVLQDVLERKRAPESPAEWDAAVRMGHTQGRFLEVVAFTEACLQASAEPLEDPGTYTLYNSACAAVLLAASSEPTLSDGERDRVRALARAWLDLERERWTAWIEQKGERAAEGRRMLQHALQDPDFASVRGDALSAVSEAERGAWQEVWGSIAGAIEEGGH